VNRRDAAAIVGLVGVTALWSSINGSVLDFLRSSMRVWVAVAGMALVTLASRELWLSRRSPPGSQHGSSRVGWLIAVPICVAVTAGAGSLGVWAVDRNATFANLPNGPTSFNLEQYVRATSFGGQPIALTLVDLTYAAGSPEHRQVLEGRSLKVVGFIADGDDGSVRLSRFVISCCAADAQVVQVELRSDDSLPGEGTWISVVGTLDPVEPEQASDDEQPPVLAVSNYTEIDEPDEPYEVPVTRIR
jgi:uncharacterized repeat protein (TIGR03943 family)